LGTQLHEAQTELDTYYKENGYLPDSPQVQDFKKRRIEAGRLTEAELQKKREMQYDNAWV